MNGIPLFLRPSVKPRKIDVLEDKEGAIAVCGLWPLVVTYNRGK